MQTACLVVLVESLALEEHHRESWVVQKQYLVGNCCRVGLTVIKEAKEKRRISHHAGLIFGPLTQMIVMF